MNILEKIINIHRKYSYLNSVLYAISAQVFFNGVLQFIIYPKIAKNYNSNIFSIIIYNISIILIISPSIGASLTNIRLINKNKYIDSNNDYLSILLLFNIILSSISIFFINIDNNIDKILFIILIFITSIRYYIEVYFRLNLDYKNYFIYYIIISIGYILGIISITIHQNWIITFLIGESFSLSFILYKKQIITFNHISKNFMKTLNSSSILLLSYLLYSILFLSDRIIIYNFSSNKINTSIYFTISIISKSILLLIEPLNNVIISYCTKHKIKITKILFIKVVIVSVITSIIILLVCYYINPIFIRILYSSFYEQIKDLNFIINLVNIILLLGTFLIIFLLIELNEKYQFLIQIIHFIIFFILTITLTIKYQIYGFIIGAIIANFIRLIIIVYIGLYKLKNN